MNIKRSLFSAFLAVLSVLAAANPPLRAAEATHTFAIGTNDFLLDGQRFQIRCGEVHAARVPREYWQHRLQMAKAMGLNTVCAYLFWNMHEPQPGRIQLVRPGRRGGVLPPRAAGGACGSSCGPAPMPAPNGKWAASRGGCSSTTTSSSRTRDPRYLDAAKRYLKEVGRVLGPLQITHGGPILMVQVENEYGFYGKDAEYMGELRQALLDAGFDVPLFACNPPQHLQERLPQRPVPRGEFRVRPGHRLQGAARDSAARPAHVRRILSRLVRHLGRAASHRQHARATWPTSSTCSRAGASFSIYMAHGGTTFGLWSGADRPFKPDTSSYDYDAPISEAGWATDKFFKTRELFARYLLPGETIPEPPAKNPVITLAATSRPWRPRRCLPTCLRRYRRPRRRPWKNMTKATAASSIAPRCRRGRRRRSKRVKCTISVTFSSMASAWASRTAAAATYKVRLPERAQPARLDILVETDRPREFWPGSP